MGSQEKVKQYFLLEAFQILFLLFCQVGGQIKRLKLFFLMGSAIDRIQMTVIFKISHNNYVYPPGIFNLCTCH